MDHSRRDTITILNLAATNPTQIKLNYLSLFGTSNSQIKAAFLCNMVNLETRHWRQPQQKEPLRSGTLCLKEKLAIITAHSLKENRSELVSKWQILKATEPWKEKARLFERFFPGFRESFDCRSLYVVFIYLYPCLRYNFNVSYGRFVIPYRWQFKTPYPITNAVYKRGPSSTLTSHKEK